MPYRLTLFYITQLHPTPSAYTSNSLFSSLSSFISMINMPSTTTPLATCLSGISHLPHLVTRLIPRRKRSHVNEFPITRSGLASHCQRQRIRTRAAISARHNQTPPDFGPSPTFTPHMGTSYDSNDDDVWSWAEADERQFSVMTVAGGTPDTNLFAEENAGIMKLPREGMWS